MILEWRSARRMYSVWAALAAVAWGLLPASVQAPVLGYLGVDPYRVPFWCGLIFLVARVINQPTTQGVERGI